MQSQREKETRKLLAFANILYVAGRKAYATQNNFSALPRKMDEVQTFFLTSKIYFLCSDPILRGFRAVFERCILSEKQLQFSLKILFVRSRSEFF